MSEPLLSERIAYTGGGLPEYIGQCLPGLGVDANPVWRIRKLVYSGSNVVEIGWAGGNLEFNKMWIARAAYAYT